MSDIYIPPASRKTLLAVARETLETFVRGLPRQTPGTDDPHLLAPHYGAFVSLHRAEELRGCVGTCFPTRALYQTVIEMTEAAASRDYRVPPVEPAELADIEIEISVLSPLRLIDDPLSLAVGVHGLHIAQGERRGVLLPQVATHYGWDLVTFLGQACLKAGLPEEAWKQPGTKISSFTALILKEGK